MARWAVKTGESLEALESSYTAKSKETSFKQRSGEDQHPKSFTSMLYPKHTRSGTLAYRTIEAV